MVTCALSVEPGLGVELDPRLSLCPSLNLSRDMRRGLGSRRGMSLVSVSLTDDGMRSETTRATPKKYKSHNLHAHNQYAVRVRQCQCLWCH